MADEAKKLEVTEEELRQLPRWAVVAFAARCARRVQPLFTKYWAKAPDEYVMTINTAITLAESSARVGRADAPVGRAHVAAGVVAYDAARPGAYEGVAYEGPIYPAAGAAAVARAAAGAAAAAADANAGAAAADAAYAAAGAARAYSFALAAIRPDFELLKSLAAFEGWTPESPVDPDLLGPLWPQGVPEGWPDTLSCEDDVSGLQVEFEVPDGTSDEEALRLMDGYLSRLNALHRAIGGKGLRISPPIEVMEPAGTTVEANP